MWFEQATARGVRMTDDVLRIKVQRFAIKLKILDEDMLKFSNSWSDAFKQSHGIKQYRLHGEAASILAKNVEAARKRLHDITKKCATRDIYNMNKTVLYYHMPPNKTLATKQMLDTKGEKT